MYAGIPIIGIVGGIGSGKSFVAKIFGELGCLVIDSDAQARAAYAAPVVQKTLREWWGDAVFNADQSVNRAAIARKVFTSPAERERLEGLIHPMIACDRERVMRAAVGRGEGAAESCPAQERAASDAADPPRAPIAFVWDAPLLFEAGLAPSCDRIVFVHAPRDVRLTRVAQGRGWSPEELERRENLQWGLDRKRDLSDDVITNTAEAEDVRRQVRSVLSRILAR